MKKHGVLSVLVMAVVIGLAGIAQADLDEGLVAYYPFNGNANDESGNGNDGTVHGASLIEDRFGNANSAYNFDGLSNYISVPHSNSLNISGSKISLVAWISPKTIQSSYKIIWKLGACSEHQYHAVYGIGNDADRLQSRISQPDCKAYDTYSDMPTDQTWYNIVWTFDRPTSKLFINGVLVQTLSVDVSIVTSNYPVLIGARQYDENDLNNIIEYFNGTIDDIRIYNRALSESEIQELYNKSDCTFTESCPQAELDSRYQAGRQACIDDPASCDIEVGGGYDEAFEAGRLKCIEDPDSCGIDCPENNDGQCEVAILNSSFQLDIPRLVYTTPLGEMNLWAKFDYSQSGCAGGGWLLSGVGEIADDENVVDGQQADKYTFTLPKSVYQKCDGTDYCSSYFTKAEIKFLRQADNSSRMIITFLPFSDGIDTTYAYIITYPTQAMLTNFSTLNVLNENNIPALNEDDYESAIPQALAGIAKKTASKIYPKLMKGFKSFMGQIKLVLTVSEAIIGEPFIAVGGLAPSVLEQMDAEVPDFILDSNFYPHSTVHGLFQREATGATSSITLDFKVSLNELMGLVKNNKISVYIGGEQENEMLIEGLSSIKDE